MVGVRRADSHPVIEKKIKNKHKKNSTLMKKNIHFPKPPVVYPSSLFLGMACVVIRWIIFSFDF